VQGSRRSPNSEHLRPPPSLVSDSQKMPHNNRLRDELRITKNVRGFIRPGRPRKAAGPALKPQHRSGRAAAQKVDEASHITRRRHGTVVVPTTPGQLP